MHYASACERVNSIEHRRRKRPVGDRLPLSADPPSHPCVARIHTSGAPPNRSAVQRESAHRPVQRSSRVAEPTMVVKIYISGISGNKEVSAIQLTAMITPGRQYRDIRRPRRLSDIARARRSSSSSSPSPSPPSPLCRRCIRLQIRTARSCNSGALG